MRLASLIAAATLVALSFAADAASRTAREAGGHVVTIAVHEASGEVAQMTTTWFVPPGKGPFPVVLFSHGRAGNEADRDRLAPGISRSQLAYWLGKGVAVVSPVRPGYGDSGGGGDVEQNGAHFDAAGHCTSTPDYRRTADAAVLSIQAALQWLRAQPWADADDVLLVGQSVGGLASVAAAAQPLPGVVGYVNFAGGAGGSPARSPGASCDPDQLRDLFASYGRTTRVPSLWLYATNDQYWGPDAPAAWHAAFAQGARRTRFVQAPAVADGDGHGLSRHDASLWAPAVDAFIATLQFLHSR